MHRVLLLYKASAYGRQKGLTTHEVFSRQTTARMVGYKSTTCCRPVTSAFELPKSEEHADVMEDEASCNVWLLHEVDEQRVFR